MCHVKTMLCSSSTTNYTQKSKAWSRVEHIRSSAGLFRIKPGSVQCDQCLRIIGENSSRGSAFVCANSTWWMLMNQDARNAGKTTAGEVNVIAFIQPINRNLLWLPVNLSDASCSRDYYRLHVIFTARCTLVQSAVLRLLIVHPSVCP